MGVGDRLKSIGSYVRKLRRSTDPDSYYQYRRGRERERKEAEHVREDAERHGEQERVEAERGRDYEERYEAERSAEEPRTEAPSDDTTHRE
jgi:hypothetical protein